MNSDPPLDTSHKAAVPEPDHNPRTARLGVGSKPAEKKLSEILQDMVNRNTADRISVGDLLLALEGRAVGALLLVFAFPNVLPSPPGLAGILGLPLVYLSTQLMLGRTPWLPPFIANRSLTREVFSSLITRAIPWIARAERMLKQRLWAMVGATAQRLLGALCLFLSLVLILPIPFGNMLPSIAICVLALGLLERDGAWIVAGCLAAVVATTIVGSVAYALIKSTIFLILNGF